MVAVPERATAALLLSLPLCLSGACGAATEGGRTSGDPADDVAAGPGSAPAQAAGDTSATTAGAPLSVVVGGGGGEDFRVTVKNASGQALSFRAVGIERAPGPGGRPHSVRSDVGCPCRALCKKAPLVLTPGAVHEAHWDLKDDDCKPATPASYRAVVTDPAHASGDSAYLGLSSTFVVNPPTDLTPGSDP